MPVRFSTCRRFGVLALGAASAALASAPLLAQDAGGQQEDPGVVVTRTVQPRIAYRGVPREDNPVHAKATTFPARIFHDTVGGMLGELVGDDLLGQHGSAGLAGNVSQTLTGSALLPATVFGPAAQGGAGRVPTGPGASVGGAIGGATGGLGGRISGGVMQALTPAATMQGGGR